FISSRILIFVIIGIFVGIYFNSQKIDIKEENVQVNYIDVSAQEAKELIDNNPDLIIIDVSPNYAKGHLPGAINYYVGDGSLDNAISSGELDLNAIYLVYCHVDSASRGGAQKLINAGFENIYRLSSHYSGWVDAGYEIEI
ncbi:rhodanese-like domain-containing protein, partial [Nanoarchaeota archaeon]